MNKLKLVYIGVVAFTAAATAQDVQGSRPNIILIMADDMGFSDLGCYGGEIDTPNLDRLAKNGLRFTQFYNNAKCGPTRASLLTGLYSQQVDKGGPGLIKMTDCVTIAEALGAAGYRTLMTGKWHAQELPTDRGFDRYFGLTDGCCNFFNPGKPIEGQPQPAEKNYPRNWSHDGKTMEPFTPRDPNFYTTDAFTNEAISYLDEYKSEDRPYFLYIAYTAPHYPLHAFPEDIEKYRGKYLNGWDVLRQNRYQRMIDMGIIDPQWPLSPRDDRVAPWDDITNRDAWNMDALQRRNNRGLSWKDAKSAEMWDLKMAVYAAMVDRMDRNIGKLMDKVDELGEKEDTLVLFLTDNGGCAELVHITPDVPPGPVHSYRTVDPPWAQVQNTPFRKYKRYNHEGGIATPLIAHWPRQIEPGRMTDQVGHIIDIMATCVDLADTDYPASYQGRKVQPLEGESLAPIFKGDERKPHDYLFWQFSDAAAVRHGDWKLVRSGRPWELYDMKSDRTELNNLVDTHPEQAEELATKWDEWAGRVGARKN